MDILHKRTFSKMKRHNHEDDDEDFIEPPVKKQQTEDAKKIQLLKKELKEAYNEISSLDRTVNQAWARVKEEAESKRHAQKETRLVRSKSQEKLH